MSHSIISKKTDAGVTSMKTKMVPTEIYSRVVGYYRPVNQWNKGKQSEFADRKEYDVNALTLASEQTEKEAIAV